MFTLHILHNAMDWEAIHSIVGEWKSGNSAFLKEEQHTPHISLYIYIYIKHFLRQRAEYFEARSDQSKIHPALWLQYDWLD
jgi:hypothetical protein